MGEQLVERPVAGDTAGGQHGVGWPGGEETGRPLLVDGAVAGHVEERGGRGPADGRDEEVAFDPGAVGALYGAHALATANADDVVALAGVQKARDLDAGALEVSCRCVAAGVRAHDDRPLPGLDGV